MMTPGEQTDTLARACVPEHVVTLISTKGDPFLIEAPPGLVRDNRLILAGYPLDLFREMIDLTREQGKNTIPLGLGVKEGTRRFKEKWGGKRFLAHEFCGCRYGAAKKPSLTAARIGRFPEPFTAGGRK